MITCPIFHYLPYIEFEELVIAMRRGLFGGRPAAVSSRRASFETESKGVPHFRGKLWKRGHDKLQVVDCLPPRYMFFSDPCLRRDGKSATLS